MAATVVRYAEVSPQPWANGGGTTWELLRAGDGAWRISLADIGSAGPFSAFPGRDRQLTLVDGEVLALRVGGTEHVVEPLRPFAFSGDDEVEAALPAGPVRVLNLIAERGLSLSATALEFSRTSRLPLAADQAAYCLKGPLEADGISIGTLDLVAGPAEISGRGRVVVLTFG